MRVSGLVPQINLEVFSHFYVIEVVLRELIIETMGTAWGPYWYKRLPVDVTARIARGVEFERSTAWTHVIPHHPIYYVEFPDLRKTIEMDANWDECFRVIFVRKDIISGSLAKLEFIRNKVAHNRKVSNADLEVVRGVLASLASCLGEERVAELVLRCTCASDIGELLELLGQEAQQAFLVVTEFGVPSPLKTWEKVKEEWWFDGA